MGIVFLLQTHNDNPHIGRLVHALREFPDGRIFCHHDCSKSKPHPVLESQTISFVRPHRKTAWGRVSQLLAELDLLKLSFQEMPEAEWFMLMSGNCYPIKPISHICNFLESTPFNGFLDTWPAIKGAEGLPGWKWRGVYTRPFCKIPFVSRKGNFYWRELRVPRRGVPFSAKQPLMYGANWFILNRQLVEKVLQTDPWNHPIVRFYNCIEEEEQRHFSPEESFLQCLFHDSEEHSICRDAMRFIDWKDAKNWHPNTLTESHWQEIRNSDALFARKFDPDNSRGLLDLIDSQILCL
jgi:hypothetical protein